MPINYKQSGVDVEAGDHLVDWLKKHSPERWPHQERLVSGIGGFAGLFKAQFPGMQDPCLVACTDGVGTKIKLAAQYKSYGSVAQDLVAMCVNDLICCGAQPLFFLDYFATGRLVLENAQEFLAGLQKACLESELLLLGGETAEMPDVYSEGDFDCAGFSVGIVDRPRAWGLEKVKVGDRLLALPSSGCHSNGYSLLRKIFVKDLDQWAKELLIPTALYVKPLKVVREVVEIHAVAHITGGGMDNLPRILPNDTKAVLRPWKWPEVFKEVQKRSGMSDLEMLKTLNCGVGMVLVLPEEQVAKARKELEKVSVSSFELGHVETALGEPSWEMP
ncbi:MAG: phosphoribosylformylglycinamidine cyclo-ligase [Bdellovibrionales bacterium]|nr:phosphoribosylformylglycinamidine cyclo-ligase [Bdellovibrionales bacterium]